MLYVELDGIGIQARVTTVNPKLKSRMSETRSELPAGLENLQACSVMMLHKKAWLEIR